MASDAKEEQRNCNTCSIIPPDQVELLNSEIQEEDWQGLYVKYLSQGVLLADWLKREKLKKYQQDSKWWMGSCLRKASKGNG